ncbi:hypothetical protein GXW74_22050 [Roseomonas eburnea]|uniref:Uncharacterized protein n=1 Tax=Neoroseomonas eburnea TaxID=1346889 RepID=A0A9X9XHK2_9PROT|nr:hypothetical protein [Neoroseomonas eburnea]MBR0683188.1 hypothetical protein [Neoroseomonas eburnea]
MTADIALPIRPVAEVVRAPQRAAGGERDAGAAPPAPVPAPATPNPRLRLDGSLGMVVIEFRDAAGGVANTIPSPRQIAAYRAAVVTDAPVPVGVRPQTSADAAAMPETEAPPPPTRQDAPAAEA